MVFKANSPSDTLFF